MFGSLGQRKQVRARPTTVEFCTVRWVKEKLIELNATPCSMNGRIRAWTLKPL